MPSPPSPEIIAASHAGFTDVYSRVDIYESDTTTPWELDANHVDGSVSVDMNRDERRTASVELGNLSGRFKSQPNGFWYDKVFKLWRGIRYYDSSQVLQTYEIQLGEFYIDDIDSDHFPHVVNVSMRDATKKLLEVKFAVSTEFASGASIESIINAIAVSGGIPAGKISLPLTGVNTGKKFLFDRTTERWRAITEIATDYGYEVYFTNTGMLTMTAFADPSNPALSPSVFTFETGSRDIKNGNFEDVDASDVPSWWVMNFHSSGSASYGIERINQFRGSNSLKITVPGDNSSYLTPASKAVAVNPGEVWELGVTSRASAVLNTRYLIAEFGDTETFTTALSSVSAGPQTFGIDWQTMTTTVTVPTGAAWMRVLPKANPSATAYTAWFDEVYVKRVEPLTDNKGNLISYKKKVSSARIYNEVVVSGESSTTIPVNQKVQNNTSTSPTRIAKLGIRTYFYTSSFITTTGQALAVATNFLKRVALEQFEVGIESLLTPWIEPGSIVTLDDPDSLAADPVRYLLADLTFPLRPGAQSANLRRVTVVG